VVVNMMRRNSWGSTLVWRLTGLPIPKGMKQHGNQKETGVPIIGCPCGEGSISK
jgi:hypothetical protein